MTTETLPALEPQAPPIHTQFSVSRKELKTALGLLRPFVARRSTIPITTHVLVALTDGTVRFCATDLNEFATTALQANQQGGADCAFCLPLTGLIDLLKVLPGDPKGALRINCTDPMITIDNESGFSVPLRSLPAADFPPIPDLLDTLVLYDGPGEPLRTALSYVLQNVALQDYRPVLCRINLRRSADHLILAAADGFRLGTYTLDVTAISNQEKVEINASAVALKGIEKLLVRDSYARLATDAHKTRFTIQLRGGSPPLRVTSLHTSSVFPDYPQLIPKRSLSSVELPASTLLAAIKLAIATHKLGDINRRITDATKGIIRFRTIPDQGIVITVGGPKEEIFHQQLRGKVPGETANVALNAKYIAQALAPFGDRNIRFTIQSPGKPVALRFAEADDRTAQVIMPMEVYWT